VPLDTRVSAVCNLPDQRGSSADGTELLLTQAETIDAVSLNNVEVSSAIRSNPAGCSKPNAFAVAFRMR